MVENNIEELKNKNKNKMINVFNEIKGLQWAHTFGPQNSCGFDFVLLAMSLWWCDWQKCVFFLTNKL